MAVIVPVVALSLFKVVKLPGTFNSVNFAVFANAPWLIVVKPVLVKSRD